MSAFRASKSAAFKKKRYPFQNTVKFVGILCAKLCLGSNFEGENHSNIEYNSGYFTLKQLIH